MNTDQSTSLLIKPCINPGAAITGNGTTTGATIDMSTAPEFESLTFVVQTGTITDGSFAGAVYGGNASNMSDEVQLTGADLIGTDIALAATDDNKVARVGVNHARVNKQYYRLKLVQAGATSGGILGATAVLGNPRFKPTALTNQ
jgi:hypothetical protein